MAITLAVDNEYGYVLAVATASAFINSYHTYLTLRHRRESGVEYPNAYASAAEAAASQAKFRFNCAQRAHANYTENHASFVTSLLIAGLANPIASASLGAAWVVARFLYASGYTRKENAEKGKGRYQGVWWVLPHYILMSMAGYSAWKLLNF